MLFPFDKRIVEKDKDVIFKYIQTNYFNQIVQYIINSKFRTSVSLKGWLKEQINTASQKMVDLSNNIETDNDVDRQVSLVQSWVVNHLTYTGDTQQWDTPEKWSTAEETVINFKGDCEDGAILAYILCRLKGVPANRLLIFAGDVEGGGHCWLGFRPTVYPLNFAFMDWCYWANLTSVDDRAKFYINGQKIHEYRNDGSEKQSKYYNIWFGVNEEFATYNITYNFKGEYERES